jgi:arylsulfatase A-like enzyme
MGVPVPEETRTLPRLLKPYGYRCANFGKLHFLPHANRDHRDPHPDYGFDQLEISDEPGVYEDAYRAWVRRLTPEQLDHLSLGLPPATDVWYHTMEIDDPVKHPTSGPRNDFIGAFPFPGDENHTHTAFVAERTLDFLSTQNEGQPFLCIAGFFSPHAPWFVPQRFLDLYDANQLPLPNYPPEVVEQRPAHWTNEYLRQAKLGYYAAISEVDDHVGRILDALDAQGLADHTIVIFTSDHGEWLGDHFRFGKGYPGDDAVTRVPLIVQAPQITAKTRRTEHHLLEAVDVVPTLLAAAGIQIPPHLAGNSFWGLLNSTDYEPRSAAITEFTHWKTLRSAQYRYLIHDDGCESLWDLAHDPDGYHDLSAQPAYADILSTHRQMLLQHLLQAECPRPRVWPY